MSTSLISGHANGEKYNQVINATIQQLLKMINTW